MKAVIIAGLVYVVSAILVGGWLGIVILEARALAGIR